MVKRIMYLAKQIRMERNCFNSNKVEEIDEIFVVGQGISEWYPKEFLHDELKSKPSLDIRVDIYPNPRLIPATNGRERFVKSTANSYEHDNLLKLQRV